MLGLLVVPLGAQSRAVTAAQASADAANSPADQQAVSSGREALSKGPTFPWYDPDSDTVRRVEVQPEKDEQEEKQAPAEGNSDWGKLLVWIAIAVGLGLLAFLLIRTFLNRRPSTRHIQVADVAGAQPDRVEQLPVAVRRPEGDLLQEARRHYLDGNYREAIIYLYSHELVELDKQQVIRLSRGKTNRQYLRELAARQQLRGLLEQTMVVFEDAFFGNRAIGRERFESCWNRLRDFDSLVLRIPA